MTAGMIIRKRGKNYLVGHYAVESWFNPIFGPADVKRWETLEKCKSLTGATRILNKVEQARKEKRRK